MINYTMRNGEGKTITFTVRRNNAAVDLSSATLFLGIKKNTTDTSYIVSKVDGDFDKTQAASGVIAVTILASETDSASFPAGNYNGELQMIITSDTDVDKYHFNFIMIDSYIS